MAALARRRLTLGTLIVVLLVISGALVAWAQEAHLGGKLRAGNEVVVAADDVVEGDLYASGGLVRIDGSVEGDLIATGGQIRLNGEVGGDVLASGGMLEIGGEVHGDVRVAGGQITVSGTIAEDLFAAGGQVTLSSSGEVGEDLVFAAGLMTLDGAVSGDVLGAAGTYVRNGTVGGDENVTLDEDEADEPTIADRSLDALQRFLSILIVAGLALWLASRLVEEPARTLRQRPLASLGVGVLGMIGFVVLLMAIIIIGVLLAIGLGLVGLDSLVGTVIFAMFTLLVVLGFLFFLALVFGAPAVVGLWLGGLVFRPPAQRWLALILGLLVVVVLSYLPVVGGWIGLVVAILGLGAIILALRPRRRPAEIAAAEAAI